MALLFGLAIPIALITLKQALTNSVQSKKEIERKTGLKVFGLPAHESVSFPPGMPGSAREMNGGSGTAWMELFFPFPHPAKIRTNNRQLVLVNEKLMSACILIADGHWSKDVCDKRCSSANGSISQVAQSCTVALCCIAEFYSAACASPKITFEIYATLPIANQSKSAIQRSATVPLGATRLKLSPL